MKKTFPSFVAIDFETADYGRDSACAIGLVRVDNGEVTGRVTRLIRPPRPNILFTYIHGITWEDVKHEPSFPHVWYDVAPLVRGADFFVAHNAPFDKGVLHACCTAAGIVTPRIPFECTVRISRAIWNIRPTTLDNVCRTFAIPLKHHDAGSDTEACAAIALMALRETGTKHFRSIHADH